MVKEIEGGNEMNDKPDLRLVQNQSTRDAVERGLAAYDELHAAHQDAATRAEALERANALLNQENERLRREFKALRANRDHYMRAYAGLRATLEGFVHFSESGGKILKEAIAMADVQAYEPVPEAPRLAGKPERMPSIVEKGPAQ